MFFAETTIVLRNCPNASVLRPVSQLFAVGLSPKRSKRKKKQNIEVKCFTWPGG